MVRRYPITRLDAQAKKAGKRDGRLNHPADGSDPPPAERQYVAHAHHQVALVQAEDEAKQASLEGQADAAARDVAMAQRQTAAARAASEQAQAVLSSTTVAASMILAMSAYLVVQLLLAAVDTFANQLAFFVIGRAAGRTETLLMALGLAVGQAGIADWFGRGRAREKPLLAWGAGLSMAVLHAALAYIRAGFLSTPGALTKNAPVSPLGIAIALSIIGVVVFCATMIAADSYHENAAVRHAWARAGREAKRTTNALARREKQQLAAEKKHALLASAAAHEPARQQAVQRSWFARLTVTINQYRTSFLQAVGDGRVRPWMRRDPSFTLDLRAPITQNPLRDLPDEDGPDPLPIAPEPTAQPRTPRVVGGAAVAAALLLLSLLTGCTAAGSSNGTDHVVLFDVSDNGWPGVLRDEYVADARTLVASLHEGDCISFDVVRARADAQQYPVAGCLKPDTDNPLAVAEEREELQDSLLSGVVALLDNAQRTPNSPLAEVIAATPHRLAAHPGMRHVITVLTDGVQQTGVVDVANEVPTPASIDSAIVRMKRAGGIADLQGSRLRIAIVGGGEWDWLPQEHHRAIKQFWLAYAKAANARMDADSDYGPLMSAR